MQNKYYIMYTSRSSFILCCSTKPSVDGFLCFENKKDIPATPTQANEIPVENSSEKYILRKFHTFNKQYILCLFADGSDISCIQGDGSGAKLSFFF